LNSPVNEEEFHIDLDELSSHLLLPHTSFSNIIESVTLRVGELVSWVWILLLGVVVLNVVMRYLFGEGRIEFEEIQWHLYSIGFLMGLSYGVSTDSHIRVDLFREKMDARLQAWIELYGILLLLLPFISLVVIYAVPFVEYSIFTAERSESPAGLSHRWLIKSMLLIAFIFLGLVTFSRLSRLSCYLFGFPNQIRNQGDET
jgi:TRAP-type mannitol/chloroaromatic compound transport system permease small subunit